MLFKNIYYLGEDFKIHRGDVAVENSLIAKISDKEINEDFGEIIDGGTRLLIPGIVNSHCHVPMTLLRGYGEGLPLQRWLNERVFPFEDKMTGEDVYWGSLLGIAEQLASGVTSFTDMYDFCDEICQAVELSGIKINVSRGVVGFGDSGFYGTPQFKETDDLVTKWHGACEGKIIVDGSLHSEYLTTEKIVREMVEYVRAKNIGVHIHLSETVLEHNEGIERRGVTPAKYFENMGLLESRVTAAHGVHLTDDDISILARNNVTLTHCPTSNLKLGSGIAPIPKMLSAGVNVAIGTDGASSNNNLNMLEEMHLAGLIHRGNLMDPETMPAEQIVKMATENGAKSQGRLDTGAIKVGNKADLAVINLNKPHLMPAHDIMSDIVFAVQSSDVELTMVDGEVLYRNGEFLKFNIEEVIKKANKSAHRIASLL